MDRKRNYRTVTKLTAVVVGLALLFSAAYANDVGIGTATASVAAALAITTPADLDFGTVYAGVAKTQDKAAAGAGVFTVTGQPAQPFQAFLDLPEYLWDNTSRQRMDLTFTDTDAGVDLTGNADPASYVGADFDPRNLGTITIGAGETTANIFLGGKVTPSVYQASGTYTADIVLTVWYEGT
ncbi:hypothetical protein GF420_02625 [candidate division GN15 bacterium]|nr:hypothetical protein [candidate division GN15 bacterium]